MRLFTAPETPERYYGRKWCFLAGGITDCWNWQKEVISNIRNFEYEDHLLDGLFIFNPRRDNFPINDPNASEEQIAWEFAHLNRSEIFSMYFCNSEKNVQPICMYELGRQLALRCLFEKPDRRKEIVITIEDGYCRTQDVLIQTKLATGIDVDIKVIKKEDAPKSHALRIINAFENRSL